MGIEEQLKNIIINDKASKCKGLMDDVASSMDDIKESMSKLPAISARINDSYGNDINGIGTDDKIKSFTSYGFNNNSLNWLLWMALYNDSWVFKKAIDKPAQDMVNCGVKIDGLEDGEEKAVYDDLSSFRPSLIELLQWGRLFGGSVAVMMFENLNDADYANPMDPSKIRKSKKMRMYVTDRWYGCAASMETVSDMMDIDFSKPKYYDISFSDGHTIRVHHSFVLRFEGRSAPKLVKMGQLQGWGYAEGCHIINELARDDQLKSSVTSLVNKSLIEVVKMSGMRGVFMGSVDSGSEDQLKKRLEMVNWARNYNSLTFLDKDDEYSQFGFSGLSGLSDLLQQNMWLISSALDMQGVLFGDLKSGFSTDQDAMERYDTTINNLCENYFRNCMEKLLKVIYLMEGIDKKVRFTFNSLLTSSHDKDKMEGLKNFQQLLSGMLNDGVIDTSKYAEIMSNYCNKNILSFNLSQEDINKLKDKTKEEMENIHLDEDEEE